MKMSLAFLLILLFCGESLFAKGVLFPNFREGGISAYDFYVDENVYANLKLEISEEESLFWQEEFLKSFEGQGEYCVNLHLEFLNEKLSSFRGRKRSKLLSYLRLLRSRALLDDYSYEFLFGFVSNYNDNVSPIDYRSSRHENSRPAWGEVWSRSELRGILSELENAKRKASKASCLDSFYLAVLQKGVSQTNLTTNKKWQNFLKQLYRENGISRLEYKVLVAMVKAGLYNRNYTLNGYRNKLLSMNKIYNIDTPDSTNYFRVFKEPGEMTDRMKLYNNKELTPYVIGMKVRDFVERMRDRLEADRIEVVRIRDGVRETDYSFSSVQQQRYAVFMLKEELEYADFDIALKNKGLNIQVIFATGYELGLFSGRDMEGVAILREKLEPKVDEGIDWKNITQEIFTAGIFLFPEKRALLLVSGLLVNYFFPDEEIDGELHVF